MTEHLLELRVRGEGGAEAGAGQQQAADEEDVALALVDLGRRVRRVPVLLEPAEVGRSLTASLLVVEARRVDHTVEHRRTVRREDHVREVGDRVDQLDGVAE